MTARIIICRDAGILGETMDIKQSHKRRDLYTVWAVRLNHAGLWFVSLLSLNLSDLILLFVIAALTMGDGPSE